MSYPPGKGGVYVVDPVTNSVVSAAVEPEPAPTAQEARPAPAEPEADGGVAADETEDEGGM